jgi:hypothetical protein
MLRTIDKPPKNFFCSLLVLEYTKKGTTDTTNNSKPGVYLALREVVQNSKELHRWLCENFSNLLLTPAIA